ncbi:MAG: hypothetical protein Q8P80_04045 [Candidatus Levybacteria bacterium]|nr:hypothetical protein [Candidatus Levybacteria bacterium]
MKQVLSENQKAVDDYKKGKENVIMFLVGATYRKLQERKLDPNKIKNKIINHLKS